MALAQSYREPLRPAPLLLSPAMVVALCAISLLVLGITVLFSAGFGFKDGPYHYVVKQLIGVGLATGACIVVSRLNFEFLRRYAFAIGIGLVVLLIAVRIPGIGKEVNGSWRWLAFGSLRLQPSEFAKLGLVFCLAHYLAINQSRLNEFWAGYGLPMAIIAGTAGLMLIEPDFGTAALTIAIGITLLFLAGARWRYLITTVGIALAGLSGMVMLNANRLHRFVDFLDVEGNKSDGTYQLYQSLAAFAVGGTTGAGLGQGRQQMSFLPEAHTDFIFAVIGEELGLIFTLAVVVVFLIMFIAGMRHMMKAPNLFQFLLVAGTVLLITLQAIINLGVVTGILPTKGMSLPFISAGLSNLLLMGMLIGILFNTERTWKQMGFGHGERLTKEVTE